MLRAATELSSLKSIREDASVRRKLPSAKKKKDLRRMKMTVCRVGSYEVGLVIMEKIETSKLMWKENQ